ncbi:hypothetical protein NLG97_g11349 [Lecanicillium saksenae]|uniref:Uncharacterized protein n=1 Tax=Lecanicillium saksenae TaxID=468837 RepID=A0ACC1QCF5_9HYPO|nr:hypothetical protein NLG97_g11349 [Lecanicillium saksenae]
MALSWVRPEASTFYHNGGNVPGFLSFLYGYAKVDETDKTAPENCGFSIMLNGGDESVFAAGLNMARAITAKKNWPPVAKGSMSNSIPSFRPIDDGTLGDAWKAWKGDWLADKAAPGQQYTLGEGEDGKPVVFYGGVGPIALLRTAEDNSFDLEGLQMNAALDEKEGEKVVNMKSRLSGDTVELKAVKS